MPKEDMCPFPWRITLRLGEERWVGTINIAFLAHFPYPLNICIGDIIRVPIFGKGTPS